MMNGMMSCCVAEELHHAYAGCDMLARPVFAYNVFDV